MTLRAWFKRFREGLNRSHSGPGEFFDYTTYKGSIRWFIFSCVATYVLWHTYDLFAWWDGLWGIEKKIDPGQQSWARLWALIIGGMGMLTAIVAMIFIPINRHRARKSAEGQWYDRPDLMQTDLVPETAEPAELSVPRSSMPEKKWSCTPPTTTVVIQPPPAPIPDLHGHRIEIDPDGRVKTSAPQVGNRLSDNKDQ